MAKIKADVISGFLGAGKTTLLSKYAAYRIKQGERIAIIENEFGETGIDGAFLKNEGLSVYEIVNGCICCSLKGDIISTLKALAAEKDLARVIIEPTGIFMLNEIYEIIGVPELAGHYEINAVVTVVDGRNYLKQQKRYGWFFENQIKWAHRLILSKTGLIDKDAILRTIASLQEICTTLEIEAKLWDKFTDADWERLFGAGCPSLAAEDGECSCGCRYSHGGHLVHEGFSGVSIPCSRSFDRLSLEATVKMLSSGIFGDIPRAKGIVADESKGSIEFNYVNGDIEIRPRDKAAEKEYISFIGSGINKSALLKLFV
ncbi:MAG: GTP-binding protein [Clostridia bacterium]|nr:GTP-binding protein [Clostridia bacterium]